MPYYKLPSVAAPTVYLNATAVGALESFHERCTQALTTLRQLGSCEASAIHKGEKSYLITLRYLLPPGSSIIDPNVDLHTLSNFTLEIKASERTLRFTGCECAVIETGCTAGESIFCQAQIHALVRECTQETG